MHLFPAEPTPIERLRTERRHLCAAQLSATFASQHATLAWTTYLAQVESGESAAEARRRLDVTLAQHAYAWAVVRSARLDALADAPLVDPPPRPYELRVLGGESEP